MFLPIINGGRAKATSFDRRAKEEGDRQAGLNYRQTELIATGRMRIAERWIKKDLTRVREVLMVEPRC